MEKVMNKIREDKTRIFLTLAGVTFIVVAIINLSFSLPKSTAYTCQCGFLQIPFDSIVPGDSPIFANQTNVDCFAWWEFISLNWPTSAGSNFGDPGNLNPVQWETYMPQQLLFQQNAALPPPWGSQLAIPASLFKSKKKLHPKTKLLTLISKTDNTNTINFDTSNISEAAPFGEPNWLGSQNGRNVWYDIRINKDEYDYVVSHKFYDANKQWDYINNQDSAINLPPGSYNGATGAIELKAAWMEVTDPQNSKWNRYKLSPAVVIDPVTDSARSVTVALVGLHILHKTAKQPTWIWATFEHVDNVPGQTSGPYNFNNPKCQSQSVNVASQCLPPSNKSPVTISCTPNTSPPYYLCKGGANPVPIQVTRQTPIDNNASQVNSIVQAAIAKQYPKSVWQYYQLVNVVWSSSPDSSPVKPVQVPRQFPGKLPTIPVANTTLETYAQTLTCIDCHSRATIAPSPGDTTPVWSSDFSFAISSAGSSTQRRVKWIRK